MRTVRYPVGSKKKCLIDSTELHRPDVSDRRRKWLPANDVAASAHYGTENMWFRILSPCRLLSSRVPPPLALLLLTRTSSHPTLHHVSLRRQ